MKRLIVIRGGGEMATGIALTLHTAGFRVLMLERALPSATRREVTFSDAVYDGKKTVERVTCTFTKSKKEAEKLGWSGGPVDKYAPGMAIGGSRFGNYEGLLPEAEGRTYTECDIDTLGAEKRGAKRIVFSNDGLIYYTDDHYETFELLYGEEAP